MSKPDGFFKKDGKTRPRHDKKKKGSGYNGQTKEGYWTKSSIQDVKEAHSRRTSTAQKTDESLRAPLSETKEDWMKTPNRLDVTGVDTPTRKEPKPKKPKRYQTDEYVFLEPITSGSKPYRVVSDKGGLVKVAQFNVAMGRWTYSEVPRHMIKGRAPIPEGIIPFSEVSYNKATGWMHISFPEKPPEDVRTGMKANGFRYMPRSKMWRAKWTVTREDFALQITGSKMKTVDIEPNWLKKAEYSEAQALKHQNISEARHEQFSKELKTIPFGQPILVGHHSERGHRAHLKRLDGHMKKAIEESNISKKYQERAQRQKRKARGESPELLYRRIQRMEAEERGWIRSLERFQLTRKLGEEKARKLGLYYQSASEEKRTKRALVKIRERLARERQKYKESGGIASDTIKFEKGDLVESQFGIVRIVKVNPKTIRVIKGDWKLKLDKSQIYGKVDLSEKEKK